MKRPWQRKPVSEPFLWCGCDDEDEETGQQPHVLVTTRFGDQELSCYRAWYMMQPYGGALGAKQRVKEEDEKVLAGFRSFLAGFKAKHPTWFEQPEAWDGQEDEVVVV